MMTQLNYFQSVDNYKNMQALKKAYLTLVKVYHPDVSKLDPNNANEAMKAINNQYTELRAQVSRRDFGEEKPEDGFMAIVNAVVNGLVNLDGIAVELMGHWLWVTGDTKQHKEVLKGLGFFWARKKKAWYWRPSWAKSSFGRGKASLSAIRQTYGSVQMADTKDSTGGKMATV